MTMFVFFFLQGMAILLKIMGAYEPVSWWFVILPSIILMSYGVGRALICFKLSKIRKEIQKQEEENQAVVEENIRSFREAISDRDALIKELMENLDHWQKRFMEKEFQVNNLIKRIEDDATPRRFVSVKKPKQSK